MLPEEKGRRPTYCVVPAPMYAAPGPYVVDRICPLHPSQIAYKVGLSLRTHSRDINMSIVTRIFWSVVITGYIAVCMVLAITALLILAPVMWVLRSRRYVLLRQAQAR
jgi:hypothetical protein